MHNRIGGLIFDLDGTLLNTLEDLASAMNRVLSRHGFTTHKDDAYRYFVGDGVAKLVERALEGSGASELQLEVCCEEFISEYENCNENATAPYPGVVEVLEELANRQIPMTVLSNKPHELTVDTVRSYFSAIPFVAIIGDGIFPRKPDPEAAAYCAAVMGIDTGHCLYTGDTGTDMKTAVAAGMPAVGVRWGFRDEKELQDHGARWIIGRPDELFEIIDNFN